MCKERLNEIYVLTDIREDMIPDTDMQCNRHEADQ